MSQNLILTTLVLFSNILFAQQVTNHEVKPIGIYAEIDIQKSNNALKTLLTEESNERSKVLDEVIKNPNDYNPTVLYALSDVLFNSEKKDLACFWFYVAQLRARYDANLCMDESAKSGVSLLNERFGPNINKYAFTDIKKLEETINKVVEFVRTNEENYDHRWLNLHGMDAMIASLDEEGEKKEKQKELSQPKKRWKKIKEKTIKDYFEGFQEYLKSKK